MTLKPGSKSIRITTIREANVNTQERREHREELYKWARRGLAWTICALEYVAIHSDQIVGTLEKVQKILG